jgi:arginine deiminase
MTKIKVDITSEIGELECAILHTPGPEVENMTPENAERALYSDILNLAVVENEYQQFHQVLKKHAKVFQVSDLLKDILENKTIRRKLLKDIIGSENIKENLDYLSELTAMELATKLIQGVVMRKDNLTRYFDTERYSLRPLHNFFFTRDASSAIGNNVLINKMATRVRERESLIMEYIFENHSQFSTGIINPNRVSDIDSEINIEGGDILVAREDTLLLGTGARTSVQGVDYILESVKESKKIKHIIVQEVPDAPESFIHLDMVFTFLDVDACMVYEPVIMTPNHYRTVHIKIDNDKVNICTEKDLLTVLKKLDFDLKPIICGGQKDKWIQEREQWHSGANFFALAPGKIIGYGRNVYTLEELNKNGFEILSAYDVIKGKVNINDYKKYFITIDGAELARGGGGARCMTMPFRRKPVSWK